MGFVVLLKILTHHGRMCIQLAMVIDYHMAWLQLRMDMED
jgi:hypothetical protein